MTNPDGFVVTVHAIGEGVADMDQDLPDLLVQEVLDPVLVQEVVEAEEVKRRELKIQ